MKNEVVLSPGTFEGLLRHLVDIEERQDQILEDFSLKTGGEYREYGEIFKNYVYELRKLVENANKAVGKDDTIPMVTIGALVQVRNSNNLKEHSFHIVSPNYHRNSSKDVSCLSPVGRALILRRVGDKVTVQAPGGVFPYDIIAITYIGE